MTSTSNAPRSADPDGSTTQATPRLQLDPNGPAEPYLDGAWWPGSTDLSEELPALLTALSAAHLGPVALVGYRRDAWKPAPGNIDLAGHAVHLQGFVSPDPPTLVVVDDNGRRVTMRVVPPDTDDAAAAELMAAAAHRSEGHDDGGAATNADAAAATSLDEVATRLARLPGNAGLPDAALISRWVAEAADQFREAPIQAFVPILVEHIVRGRLYSNRADRRASGTG